MDAALSRLITEMNSSASTLLICDENAVDLQQALDATVITHRYDIYLKLHSLGMRVSFNDLELPGLEDFQQMGFRVAKEKSVNQHLIQHFLSHASSQDSQLLIGGRKNEGIKGYYDALKKVADLSVQQTKFKDIYLLRIQKKHSDAIHFKQADYHQCHELASTEIFGKQLTLLSKEGVFSRKRLDPGSEFFLQTLEPLKAELQQYLKGPGLDLGCGSGHLCLALYALGCTDIYATDNNAAALEACRASCEHNAVSDHINTLKIVPSDAGSGIQERFSLIFCNPPFHQGFKTSDALSQKFARNTARLLAPNGIALFVCNSFVGMEKLATESGLQVESLNNNGQFKVLKLWR